MYEFDAPLWRWDAKPSTFFVSLPEDVSDEIAARAEGRERGFGSVKVRVTTGGSTWATSVVPDGTNGTYALPIKAAVRKAEGLDEGTAATFVVALVELD